MAVSVESGVKWVPVSFAAQSLKISPQRVYKMIAEGKLIGTRINGCHLVSLRSLSDCRRLRFGEGAELDADRTGV